MEQPELLTTDELAKRLKISPHTVKLWSRRKKIPTVWLSQTVRRFNWTAVLDKLSPETTDTEISEVDGGRQ